MRLLSVGVMILSILLLAVSGHARPSRAALLRQVAASERACAATLAAHDPAAVGACLSDEAIFTSGAATLRGRAAIVAAWAADAAAASAASSRRAERIDVVDSGTLAYSAGTVHDAAGRPIARFHSTWRLEAPGRWKIVLNSTENQ